MKLVTAAQMRRIDMRMIEERGVSARALMEAAGRAIADTLIEDLEAPEPVLVLVGPGNNGGDGLVAARVLAERGWPTEVLAVRGDDFAGASAEVRAALPGEVPLRTIEELGDGAKAYIDRFGVVVDAMLGTGTSGPPRPPMDAVIRWVNGRRRYVLSADIPTGLDADTGQAETAIRANRTVTIGLPKRGMVTAQGPALSGAVRVAPIQFARDLLTADELTCDTMSMEEAAALLPPRPFDGNKGTFGLVSIVAGSAAMPGAAVLATLGALRSGVGLVRVYAPDPVRAAIMLHAPEAMFLNTQRPLPDAVEALRERDWQELQRRCTAMVIGPGIGADPRTRDFLFQALERGLKPLVLDADALNIMSEERDLQRFLTEETIVTPHPGELARILRKPVSEVQADRWRAAEDAAEMLRCVVVLKGHGTLIARPDGRTTHIPSGNTALAKGGSGDVLAGMIGGLLAQGLETVAAAKLGCWVHGLAADIAVREMSPRGLLLRDIVARIPIAFTELEGNGPQSNARTPDVPHE